MSTVGLYKVLLLLPNFLKFKYSYMVSVINGNVFFSCFISTLGQ